MLDASGGKRKLNHDSQYRWSLIPRPLMSWSSAARTIGRYSHEITDRFNCHFHYTITAYGKDVEPDVPSIDESIETLKELSAQVGKEKIIWRYDPVLLTDKYTIAYHFETFDYMAERIAPYVDRCLFSFVVWYKKLAFNMPELQPISDTQKDIIAKGLREIAARHKL